MRPIDADALHAMCEGIVKEEWNSKTQPVSWADAYEAFMFDIEDMPTIDAVEVVRCKDCKYCDKYRKWSEEEYLGCGINVADIYSVDPMHYCSHGKRKVGEENAAD